MSAITMYETKFNISEEQKNPEFFCEGLGSNLVITVTNADLKDKSINIYCDGEMRINHNGEIITDYIELINNDIIDDDDLNGLYDESKVQMNPWFDLYDQDGEHLDIVLYDIHDAMETAKNILIDMQREDYDRKH
jgi:hypothetical protein